MTSVGCASGSIQRRKNSVEKSLQKYIAILSNSRVLLAVEQFNSPITNSLLMLDHLRKKSVVFLSFHCLFFFSCLFCCCCFFQEWLSLFQPIPSVTVAYLTTGYNDCLLLLCFPKHSHSLLIYYINE